MYPDELIPSVLALTPRGPVLHLRPTSAGNREASYGSACHSLGDKDVIVSDYGNMSARPYTLPAQAKHLDSGEVMWGNHHIPICDPCARIWLKFIGSRS